VLAILYIGLTFLSGHTDQRLHLPSRELNLVVEEGLRQLGADAQITAETADL
jgi:hypothetical protein